MSTNGKSQLTDKIDFRSIRKKKTATVYLPQIEREVTMVPIPTHVLISLREDPYAVEKQLAWSIVNPSTLQPIYDPENSDDIANLAELTLEMTHLITPVFNKLNGLDRESIEETEKNSSASPTTDSAIA